MSYSADTFVADEQPTTAKWNKLWANDASFNDGTGIGAGVITPAHRTGGYYIGTIAGATTLNTLGNKSVSGVGFSQGEVDFYSTPASSAQDVSGMGGMTAISQFARSNAARASVPSTQMLFSTTRCFYYGFISTGGVYGHYVELSRVSMDTDGFTVNVEATVGGGVVNDVLFIARR